MKTLNQCNWKAYPITDIFTITATKSGIDRNKLTGESGDFPYITRTDNNNAWDSFIGHQPKYKMDSGNVISVGLDTQTAFYQPIPFYTGQNLQVFSNEHMNKHIAMFILPLLKIQLKKFNWGGNGATLGRLKRLHIMLPSTPEGTPDYTFMEEYMCQKEQTILAKYKAHISNVLDNQSLIGGGKSLNVNWKEFYFTDVFIEIQRGKRLKRADHSNGKMPYVSSTALCNGVDGFVGNTESVNIFSNCITIANSGSVGSAFFHSYEFVASDHVTKLQNKEVSKYAYLFMLPIINRLAEKYSFNREINDKRIKRERFVLPATPEGTPDFAYMDAYMRNIELQQLLKCLQHLNVCL